MYIRPAIDKYFKEFGINPEKIDKEVAFIFGDKNKNSFSMEEVEKLEKSLNIKKEDK